METTQKPSVVTVKFGDGYRQRWVGGLSAGLKALKPVFHVTNEYSRAALGSFLLRHAGMRVFLWRPPKYDRTARVVCREQSISDDAIYTDSNCAFEEVTH